MKASINWLKQYTNLPDDSKAVERELIRTGTAVESIEPLDGGMEHVVVGRVLSCRDHENSDHLHVCLVDAGQGEPLQIVCGAPNVKEGLLVPTALVGAKLPGGMEIKAGKLRGVESFGMLCSATELNIPQELYPSVGAEGLLIFNEEYAPGTDVRAILGIDDQAIDVEVLANRPDCLSVWGLAREAAAVFNQPFSLPALDYKEDTADDITNHIRISVRDEDLCPRYAGRVIKNVRVAPSPLWLRAYLHAAGMRSINNIVDITNFVMLETGHPMHAFDLERVRGHEIIVRRALPGEKLTTLDEKEHHLTGGELLICDQEGPTGLAGIMGGLESEIKEGTKSLLFECAAFDRSSTRVTARGLGIRTEASGRFERGVNPRTVIQALDRACHLVEELDAGEVAGGLIDLYPGPLKPVVVKASVKGIAARCGVDISADEMVTILRRLHFSVAAAGDTLTVTAPDFRQDIEQEADICEEVLRMAGYDRIPSTLMKGEAMQGFDSQNRLRQKALSSLLNGRGYDEIYNYSFFGAKQLDSLHLSPDDERLNPLRIRNPLGEDTALMRTSLVPDMLKTLALNMARGNEQAMLYEFGTVFSSRQRTDIPYDEQPWLCLGLYDEGSDFYTLRDTVLLLLDRQGIKHAITAGSQPYLHPGRSAVITANGALIARLGEVHPAVCEEYGMDGRAYLAEIDLTAFWAAATPMPAIKELPRMPAVSRDIALVLDIKQELLPVMEAIRRAGGALMEDARLFDVYRGSQLPEGKKSCAFSLSFRAPDRSLEEKEITALMDKVQRSVKAQFGADVRS